jgi:hypothetical protein
VIIQASLQVIEQYKRQIFDHRGGFGGQSLKEELMKLLRRVDERIPHSLAQDMTCSVSFPDSLHDRHASGDFFQ